MFLDELFFSGYKNQSTNKTAFIVGVPRTATTFVLHSLSSDEKNFTSFKLWEIILAPSIIQKHFYRFWIGLDQNGVLKLVANFFDKILFSSLNGIHEMSLSKPEEDESLLIYSLSSAYLYYIFPETKLIDPLIFFDEELPEFKRKKVMRFYRKCIQRHNYFYNRNEEKIFLSKNPTFTSKMNSLKGEFPNCRFIYMYRSPYETIPSTISLNKKILTLFNSVKKEDYPLKNDIKEMLINWYMTSHQFIKKHPNNSIIIPFRDIKQNANLEFQRMYQFLNLKVDDEVSKKIELISSKSNNHKSEHDYPRDLGIENGNIDIRIKEIESYFEI